MRCLLPLVLAGALVGCGDDGADRSSTGGSGAAATPEKADCSKGMRAADLIDPPSGYELAKMDPARAEAVAKQFRSSLGDRFEGFDAKVLVRRTKNQGTAVMVLNATEPVGSDSELLKGFEDGAEENGVKVERLSIGREPGAIARTPDGAFVAMAPA